MFHYLPPTNRPEARIVICRLFKGLCTGVVTSRKDQHQYWANKGEPYSYVFVQGISEGAFQSFHVGRKSKGKNSAPLLTRERATPGRPTTFEYGVSKKELLKACFSREWLLMKRNSFVYIFKMMQPNTKDGWVCEFNALHHLLRTSHQPHLFQDNRKLATKKNLHSEPVDLSIRNNLKSQKSDIYHSGSLQLGKSVSRSDEALHETTEYRRLLEETI
ncbi:hypothetical protein IFM89_039086 [Coptis chinensis]|uniref:Uncharacterized protein n=1 Tax=Coptis chinensis TaxID=261450 RepID=A0A835IK97_9MAGN|nr:hypothetical protein IFM89_039086 [Coptis chinensis]